MQIVHRPEVKKSSLSSGLVGGKNKPDKMRKRAGGAIITKPPTEGESTEKRQERIDELTIGGKLGRNEVF